VRDGAERHDEPASPLTLPCVLCSVRHDSSDPRGANDGHLRPRLYLLTLP
jgi:hypothetical protein